MSGDTPATPTANAELSGMTIPQLRDVAKGNGVDLGDAKTKAEIVAAIIASRVTEGGENPEGGDVDTEVAEAAVRVATQDANAAAVAHSQAAAAETGANAATDEAKLAADRAAAARGAAEQAAMVARSDAHAGEIAAAAAAQAEIASQGVGDKFALGDGEEVIGENEETGTIVTSFGRKVVVRKGKVAEVLAGPGGTHDQPAVNGQPGYRLGQR